MEPQFDTTEIPEIVTFDTDFGERFGTFICFDMLFAVPALNLTRIEGVSNIVYPTAWFSETPFLTGIYVINVLHISFDCDSVFSFVTFPPALQTQFGWSFAENVNLLVAGYHNPEHGNAGSGIYLGMTRARNFMLLHLLKCLFFAFNLLVFFNSLL